MRRHGESQQYSDGYHQHEAALALPATNSGINTIIDLSDKIYGCKLVKLPISVNLKFADDSNTHLL